MKQAYELTTCGDWSCTIGWIPVKTTGLCKTIKGGVYNEERHYIQIQRKIFGIPCGKYWVAAENIKWCDPIVETTYSCNCE